MYLQLLIGDAVFRHILAPGFDPHPNLGALVIAFHTVLRFMQSYKLTRFPKMLIAFYIRS